MSRVEGKGPSQFSDIANMTIADELESRMKELERNIAVARQFIKLADESYARIRHEWDLLQQDIRVRRAVTKVTPDVAIPMGETLETSLFDRTAEPKRKTKTKPNKNRNHDSSHAPTKPPNQPHRPKDDMTDENATEATHENTGVGVSTGSPKSTRPKRKA